METETGNNFIKKLQQEKSDSTSEKDQTISEKDQLIAELMRKLDEQK